MSDFRWRLYDLVRGASPRLEAAKLMSSRDSLRQGHDLCARDCAAPAYCADGALAKALGSTARAVGSARASLSSSDRLTSPVGNNWSAPYVPCHRIVASTGFVGGFHHEWTADASGPQQNKKLAMLAQEGVRFDSKGYMLDKRQLWAPPIPA